MRTRTVICLALLVGCGEDAAPEPVDVTTSGESAEPRMEPDEQDVEDPGPIAPQPGAGFERCGLPDYAWLEPSEMGELRDSEQVYAIESPLLTAVQFVLTDQLDLPLARTPQVGIELHRIRYGTQDRGAPIEATGVVAFPDVEQSTEVPVVLLLHGTTGATDRCAPSLEIEDPATDDFASAALVAILASYGYVVVAPDYIGMKSSGEPSPELHPYLIGEATAIASWDALRAARQVLVAETDSTVVPGRVAIWGGSQGGHAAAFTVRYGPYYAPEFDVAAGVYAIPPTDLNPHLSSALSSVRSATANTILFFATASQWYDVPNGTDDVFLPPYNTELVQALEEDCGPDVPVDELDELFTAEALAAVGESGFEAFAPWDCMGRENSLTTTSVERRDTVPGLVILAENDTLVETAIERDSFDRLCEQGMRLHYLECAGASHTEGFIYSIDDALDFIELGLADAVPTEGLCERTPARICSNTPGR